MDRNSIPLQPVQSSNVKAVGWLANTLAVEFNSGGIYHYADVPQDTYSKLLASDSVGKFIGSQIKPHFKAQKVGASA